MIDNSTSIDMDGRIVRTLRDILPAKPGLRMLFVAKTPAPKSVEAGHYFQGTQGQMFWNRLRDYKILNPTTQFEDDSLLDHGFGLTDIVKIPRAFGNEPSPTEYILGMERVLDLIRLHRPIVTMFVYKRVLDEVLKRRFGVRKKSIYGFNPDADKHFNTRVFVFPMPGTPCTREQAINAMRDLVSVLNNQ